MIVDSSTLIIFAKINQLEILRKLYGQIHITKEIYREIIEEGLSINAPDAKILKNSVDKKKIKIILLGKNIYKLYTLIY